MEREHKKIPKVSIIVPVYNKGNYLEETLNSIVKQTMQDIEIICVNDASTDDSLHILEKFAQEDSRISIINNNSNQGAAVS
ncbi:MAG: glycosyltransferase, partial [Ruminococcus flavefaciens]|nr:glycosyltransferase [Ruminococcus flavefaciens]